MSICNITNYTEYFTITRVRRDNFSLNYAFVGEDMFNKYKNVFNDMENSIFPKDKKKTRK